MLVTSLGLLIRGKKLLLKIDDDGGEEDDEHINADGNHFQLDQHCVCDCIWRWASDRVRSLNGQVHSCLQVHCQLRLHFLTYHQHLDV